MQKTWIFLIPLVCLIFIPHADSYIPPTIAFSKIFVGSNHIQAKNYLGNLTLSCSGISCSISNGTKTPIITITSTAQGSITSLFCSSNAQLHTFNATSGTFTCATNNSTSNGIITSQNIGRGTTGVLSAPTTSAVRGKNFTALSPLSTTGSNNTDIVVSLTGTYSSVVSNVSLKNQTSNIGSTILYSPSISGVYHVSVYQVDTQSAIAGTLSTIISWTDESGISQTSSPAPNLSVASLGGESNGVGYIDVKGGSSIKYSTSLSGVTGTPQYNLFITVEKLS